MIFSLSAVSDSELISRLLFYPQMIRNGVLEPSAFPMDELLAKRGKDGCSVDRCDLLEDRDHNLFDKAQENANAASGRAPFGFCVGKSEEIRAIREAMKSLQALEIFEDEVTGNDPPKPWDQAHALIRKFDDSYTRSNLRGVRDRLSNIFSTYIVQFK